MALRCVCLLNFHFPSNSFPLIYKLLLRTDCKFQKDEVSTENFEQQGFRALALHKVHTTFPNCQMQASVWNTTFWRERFPKQSARVLSNQPYATPWDPMDDSLPGSSSMGFSRQEYCSRMSFPPSGDLPHPGFSSPPRL